MILSSYPLVIYPEVELLVIIAVQFFLIFGETSMLFSIIAVPVYISTSSAEGFPFFRPLSVLVISCIFCSSHSNICKVLFYCGFDLQFLDVL